MKNLLYHLFLLVLLNKTFASTETDSLKNKEMPEIKQARDFFMRHIESAHPEPERELGNSVQSIIVYELNSPLFENTATTVEENEQFQMQNESSISINPTDPDNIICSAVDYRDSSSTWVYISTDAGRTWLNKNLKKPFTGWQSSNDPSVAFSDVGTAYLVYGGFGNVERNGVIFGENGVFLSRSNDKGKTWKTHIPVILHKGQQTLDSTFEDKYYITVDNSVKSPYYHNLYIPWKRVTPRDSATQIVISKSTDDGETWSVPLAVSPRIKNSSEDTTYGQSFPLCVTGPEGNVYVCWNNGLVHGIGFAKSNDGGKTFSSPKIIQNYNIFGITKYLKSQNGYRHSLKGTVRAESYPSFVCDLSHPQRKGFLYLTWAADSIPNIYFSRSSDEGNSWSKPIIVHSDTTNDQYFHWLAIDPKNGDLAVMYLDSRRFSDNLLSECWVSYSSDGGSTWFDRPISDISFDLRLNPFGNSFAGDYSGCSFFNGKIYPSWIDMRNAVKNIYDSDVYSSSINIHTPVPPENFKCKANSDKPKELLLTWDTPKTKVFGQPMQKNDFSYLLKKDDKSFIFLPSSSNFYNDTGLVPFSEHKYSLRTVSKMDTSISVFTNGFAGGNPAPMPAEIKTISGNDSSEILLNVKIANLRADSSSLLNNLHEIKFFDENNLLVSFPLSTNDSSKFINFKIKTGIKGFYKIYSVLTSRFPVTGDNFNTYNSASSNTMTVFTGKTENYYYDSFDEEKLKKYLFSGTWGLTNKNYFSSPNSLALSPTRNYSNDSRDTLTFYPVTTDLSNDYFEISFKHAVIVQKGDSALLEFSKGRNNTWELMKFFDMEQYEPWKDGNFDNSDWKNESFRVSLTKNDTLFVRCRFHSNLVKNSSGWFVDDFKIMKASNIDDFATKEIEIYPNPASSYLAISHKSNEINVQNIEIYNSFGQKVIPDNAKSSNNNCTVINILNLNSGIYFIDLTDNYGHHFIRHFIKIND